MTTDHRTSHHDQRDTLTGGVDVEFEPGTFVSATVAYGSGFLQGDGPEHKPAHATVSLQASRRFGKQFTAFVTALNVGDSHFLLDESNTFGGTRRQDDPRESIAPHDPHSPRRFAQLREAGTVRAEDKVARSVGFRHRILGEFPL